MRSVVGKLCNLTWKLGPKTVKPPPEKKKKAFTTFLDLFILPIERLNRVNLLLRCQVLRETNTVCT